jgi:hypothetical protein
VNNPGIIISRVGRRIIVEWHQDRLSEVIAQLQRERSEHQDREPESLITLAEEIKLRTTTEINQSHAVQ